ncbi:thyrotropin-releasing hormone-degrading ectoenzyme-like isoform X2 [Linepithema humile]|uniref:thyrotropin-releasing hormone-degrading ectoenzyme-like isoform X2 n=1 Tax=Linepithema humile TaxID=83485 RepID=UPI00351E5BCB
MENSMAFRHILNSLILIVIIILSTAKFTKNETESNYNVLNFIPLHYDVKIKFDVYRNVFFGKCNIIIQINRPTENITLMSSKIFSILEIALINNNNIQKINIQKFSLINKSFNKMYIHLNVTQSSLKLLSPGTYTLEMTYVRIIIDDGYFFESIYVDREKGKILNNEIIEVIKAEELFPYWDEAVFKSTFEISICHHKNYSFLSNMLIRKEVKQEKNMDNMLWTHFNQSSLMQAQHLIILITTFTNSSYNANRFWCRKEIRDQIQYAKYIAAGVVYYLTQKSTRIVSKIDYYVVTDFQDSNVKTQEFILLREENTIYNDTLHPVYKMEVANYVTRQTISHLYNDMILWSKEGFITFLATHILNQTQLYRMEDLFVVQTQQESLRFDTLPTDSLPFGTPLYEIKSFIIWRMLYHIIFNIISDDTFWTCINNYINIQYNQTNATDTNNLSTIALFFNTVKSVVDATNSTRNFSIENIVDILLTKRHYPILYMTRNYNETFHNPILISYINYPHSLFTDVKPYELYVTYTTKSDMNFEPSDTQTHFWLSSLTPHHYMSTFDKNDWIILNLQQAGYYRINYDLGNWQKLADYLYENYTDIHVLNRAQIIDDAFYFLRQGQLNFLSFWNITKFLFKDADYVAWYPMIKAVEYMMCIWPVQNTDAIKVQLRERFDGLLLNIGYVDKFYLDSDFTKILREEAMKWACVLDTPKCRETASDLLNNHLESSVQDKFFKWRERIYCKGLMKSDYNNWFKVWNKWKNTSDNTFLEYLTCSPDPTIIKTYLTFIKSDEFYLNVTDSKTNANIVLLIIAKHAKNNIVLTDIFEYFESIKFSSKQQIDQIAILIVIITHEHDVKHFKKIRKFVKTKLTMSEKQLSFIVDAVKQKIEKRKMEYNKRVTNYGVLN